MSESSAACSLSDVHLLESFNLGGLRFRNLHDLYTRMLWTKAIAALFASVLTVLTHLGVDLFPRRVWMIKIVLPRASTWVNALRPLRQTTLSFFCRVEVRICHIELPLLKIGIILALPELLCACMRLLVAYEIVLLVEFDHIFLQNGRD